jgi:hypothetical protein
MPAGERIPVAIGVMAPSGVISSAQPRQGTRLAPRPIHARFSVVIRLPRGETTGPNAYSW